MPNADELVKCPNICFNGKVYKQPSIESSVSMLVNCGLCRGNGVIKASDMERAKKWLNYDE